MVIFINYSKFILLLCLFFVGIDFCIKKGKYKWLKRGKYYESTSSCPNTHAQSYLFSFTAG